MSWANSGNKRLRLAVLGAVLLASLVLPIITRDPYHLHLLILGGVYSLLTMGWVMILRVGQFSLGQAAYLAIGGYTSALLVMRLGMSFWLAMPIAGLMAAFIAFILGYIVLRLKGLYFAMVSFAFSEVIRLTIVNWRSLLGGFGGILDIPPPNPIGIPGILMIEFSSRVTFYYLILFLVILGALVFWRIDNSRIGNIFRSIARSDILAESLGINLMKYKVMAYVIACFFAGISGSFFAHYYIMLQPDGFRIWQNLLITIQATVGGVGSAVTGPVIGAVLLTVIGEILRGFRQLEPVMYGGLLILVVVFLPGGLVSVPGLIRSRLAGRARTDTASPAEQSKAHATAEGDGDAGKKG